jgi:hypothetical protein
MIGVDIDERGAVRVIGSVLKQINFAAANALNDVAFEARNTERTHVQEAFIIRRPFVTQGIQVPSGGKATRDHLEAELVLDPSRDFLAKFEQGGEKTPRGGHSLAIPDAARPTPQSLIPNRLRPRNLQFADGPAQSIGFRRKGGITRRGVRQKNQGLFRTFLIEGVGIFQRVGRGAGSTTRLLYAFEPRAEIPAELKFVETAREVATRSYRDHFHRRFLDALRTAR